MVLAIKNKNVRNWKKVVQNRDSWKRVVEQARTLYRFLALYKKNRSNNNRFAPDNLNYVLQMQEYPCYGNALFPSRYMPAGCPSCCAFSWASLAYYKSSRVFFYIFRIN